MIMSFQIAFVSILLLYLLATLFYLLRLVIGQKILGAIGLRLTVVAAVVQTGVLVAHFLAAREVWFTTWLEYFQIASLLLAVIFILLCFVKKFYAAGPLFITPIVVFCILSLVYDNPYAIARSGPGHGYLMFHLTTTFLSLALFCVGMISAVLFLISEHQIKVKKFNGWLAKLPPLGIIEDIHDKALLVGFTIFTFTIITGAGFAKVTTGHYLSANPKQVLSIACWIFFAVILNLRDRLGLMGHRGMSLSLAGYVGIVCLFFVGLS
jgi:ABC-type uncharacterized transport system permease subunit